MAWIVLGLVAAGKASPPVLTLLCCFLAILVGTSIYFMRRTHGLLDRSDAHRAVRKKINRQFGFINLAQWGLIFAAVFGLPHLGLGDWIVPAIILIVGIHFFPLARLFRESRQYVTGLIIVAWAIVYPIVFSPGKGDWIGAVGMGAILWMSGVFADWKAFRLLRRLPHSPAGMVPNGAHA